MRKQGWDFLVVSLPEYEYVVAEIYRDGSLLMTVDREDGASAPFVTVFDDDGKKTRCSLDEIERFLRLAREEMGK